MLAGPTFLLDRQLQCVRNVTTMDWRQGLVLLGHARNAGIVQSLADNEPEVDGIYRLTRN